MAFHSNTNGSDSIILAHLNNIYEWFSINKKKKNQQQHAQRRHSTYLSSIKLRNANASVDTQMKYKISTHSQQSFYGFFMLFGIDHSSYQQ